MSCLKHKISRSYFRFTFNQRNFIETNLLMAREYFCCNTSTSQLRFSTFFWLDFSFAVAEIRAPFSFSCDPNCLCNSTTCSFAFFKGSANFLFSPCTVARTCSFLSSLSSFPLISSFNVLEKNKTKILMWKLESYYSVLLAGAPYDQGLTWILKKRRRQRWCAALVGGLLWLLTSGAPD